MQSESNKQVQKFIPRTRKIKYPISLPATSKQAA